jgi:hypothetical protein
VNVDESNVQCVSDIQAIDEVKCPTTSPYDYILYIIKKGISSHEPYKLTTTTLEYIKLSFFFFF